MNMLVKNASNNNYGLIDLLLEYTPFVSKHPLRENLALNISLFLNY